MPGAKRKSLRSLEVCAGAGGQALGLEQAGFEHVELVELDPHACSTLRANRPKWKVKKEDLNGYSAAHLRGSLDLLAGGVPCPPFSVAGKQLGAEDERDLFPALIKRVAESEPRAVMIENVPGLMKSRFDHYRAEVIAELKELKYEAEWRLLNAKDFGVPQLRPRAVLVAMRPTEFGRFKWPEPTTPRPVTVGEALLGEMSSRGWKRATIWAAEADDVAPTLVGGSKKHGGPDLGPTRAREAWSRLGVNGKLLAKDPPDADFNGAPPCLTVRMAAILQGFPKEWEFVGKKTQAYRQVGNAFPPPVAKAVGKAIRAALEPRR